MFWLLCILAGEHVGAQFIAPDEPDAGLPRQVQ